MSLVQVAKDRSHITFAPHLDIASLPIEKIVAIRIDIFYEGERRVSQGQVLVVRESQGIGRQQWASWIALLLHILIIFLVGSQCIGPITMVLVASGIPTIRGALLQIDADRKITAQNVEGHPDNRVLSRVTFGCFAWILCTWVAPRVLGVWVAWLILLPLCVFTIAQYEDLLYSKVGVDDNWAIPEVQFPVVIKYPQHQISEMLELRQMLMAKNDKLFYRFHNISVGSYWVESIVSTLLHKELYNSNRFRWVGYKFMNLVMPILFAFQIFGVMWPWISRVKLLVIASLQADWVLCILQRTLSLFRGIYVPEFLTILLREVFSWGNLIATRLALIVEVMEYTKLKFKRFTEQSLWNLGYTFWTALANVIKIVFAMFHELSANYHFRLVLKFFSGWSTMDKSLLKWWADPKVDTARDLIAAGKQKGVQGVMDRGMKILHASDPNSTDEEPDTVTVTAASNDEERQGGFSGYDSDNSSSDYDDVSDGAGQIQELIEPVRQTSDALPDSAPDVSCASSGHDTDGTQSVGGDRCSTPDAATASAFARGLRVKRFRGRRSKSPTPHSTSVNAQSGEEGSSSDYEETD